MPKRLGSEAIKVGSMRLILNLLWLVTGGIWLALSYIIFGALACIFIVTIPAGVASFRMAEYALWPFGRTVVRSTGSSSVLAGVSNVIWFLVAGLWLALGHLTTAVGQALTIIGIPLAIANIKMIPVTCFPFGKRIVDSDAIPFGYEPMVKM
ncbi:Hypothetical protein CPI37_1474 [Corynebacterium pseudotuberculosis]|nr:Hypothetical protein CPI37_1474 [Corynebacterium pseudotuberculosis]